MTPGRSPPPPNELLRESILLRGPWFSPFFPGRLTVATVGAVLIEPTQDEIRSALQLLVDEGALKHWPANDAFESLPAGWRLREALVRARGWRHPALTGAAGIDLDEVVLAVIAAPRFASRRASGGAFLSNGTLPSRAVAVYFPDHEELTLRETWSKLAQGGLVEYKGDGIDWVLSLTALGERAYRRRLPKLGLTEDQTILDERERHELTVFFVWQSDYNASRNHIGDALEDAVATVNREHRLVVPLRLEMASRLGDGATRVDVTLMQRIRDADLVVADITPVLSYGNRLLPNPNVLIEVGFALAARRPERLLLVARRARVDKLKAQSPAATFPFDIDHVHRHLYEEPAKLRGYLARELEAMLVALGIIAAPSPPQMSHELR